ncbi:unnamed protein product [Adineta steineri]|uniref:G-protein coupled receptors family 1 profile domain-containing protein n=1 Tax=Adineta steineri TaxID=433720 RepID=A0A814QQV2_9BILA|nr:unnamed protein product [Adineta steineri]CAF4093217.1 unnamed protein product [Adineta steineri]
MSSINVDSYKNATNQSTIYGGFIVFCIGMIGNILNISIFTSLKIFRQTSAAFYMTVTSSVNIFQLVVGLLSRIMITGYNIDPTKTSSFICKARQFTLITTMLIAFTCMCFAVIDQYLSLTNSWRHFCTVKIASRLVIIAFIVWFLHGITIFLYVDLDISLGSNQTTCSVINAGYSIYYSRFLFPILLGFLPLIIRIIFGLLAFVNVRRLKKHQTPIVRLEHDKQLTTMVLVEVTIDVLITLPYIIYNHIYSNSVTFYDPISNAQDQLIIAVTRIIFYGNFAIAFYIYFCVSSRFRKQLVYVFVEIHLKRWRERTHRNGTNQIVPQTPDIVQKTDDVN